ncbi:MAG: AAA family ATPase [bacterium]|nr:AAA family ATPase [bacterium]
MYLRFFNLREQPFSITPDPRFLFLSPQHEEALSSLLYGIHQRKGFIEITGEVGTGKTILCRTLMDRLDNTVSTALIFNSYLDEIELLQAILNDFGVSAEKTTRKGYIDALNQYLLKEYTDGRNAIVLIDEAQNLEPRVLEQLRMLSNLETERDKLVQVILVGQPELHDLLATPQMRQLDQRIAVRYHINGLTRSETLQYIMHRLSVAGAANAIVFTYRALSIIYQHCAGIPRRLNLLCDRILVTAYVRGTHRITARIVRQSINDLEGARQTARSHRFSLRPIPTSITVGVLASATFLGISNGWLPISVYREQLRTQLFGRPPAATQPLLTSVPSPQPPIASVALTLEPVTPPPPPYVEASDMALARKLWQLKVQASSAATPSTGKAPQWQETPLIQFANHAALAMQPLQGNPTQLTRLSRPCLIEVHPRAAEAPSLLWVVVRGFMDHILVYQEPEGLKSVPLQELSRIWYGKLYLTLDQADSLVPMLKQGMRGTRVLALQHILNNLGYLHEKPSGRFDIHTEQAVKAFQHDHLLDADGYAGQKTLMVLSHFQRIPVSAWRADTPPYPHHADEARQAPPPQRQDDQQQNQSRSTVDVGAAPSIRRYSIQVGSFRLPEQAERLRNRLSQEGYATWVQPSQVPGQGTWYRVRVGHFTERSAADEVAERLATQEQLAILIAAESKIDGKYTSYEHD